MQFDDAFVAAHYPSFKSAAEMRSSLVATTAMERLKVLDDALADAVVQVRFWRFLPGGFLGRFLVVVNGL